MTRILNASITGNVQAGNFVEETLNVILMYLATRQQIAKKANTAHGTPHANLERNLRDTSHQNAV